jgi:hypothetical protein
MVAEAHFSTALIPHVRLVPGFQAGCDGITCGTDYIFLRGRAMYWWGDFREHWFDARLDAIEHNLEHHPMPRPSWPL